jgi:hypothetical protein
VEGGINSLKFIWYENNKIQKEYEEAFFSEGTSEGWR